MWHSRYIRLSRLALVASGIALAVHGTARAQTIPVFDQAPSLEQLRAIMIPESLPAAGRSIVLQQPGLGAVTSPVTRASAAAAPAGQMAADTPPSPPEHPPGPAPAAKSVAVGFRINFAFNSAIVPDSAREMLATVAEVLKEAPGVKARIEGHTDAVGSAGYNMDLSERRALAVGRYLVTLGVDPSRLVPVGKGMNDPLVKDPCDAKNRRVQFVRIG